MNVNKSIKIITLGCKVNQYESEKIRAQFLENGYISVEGEQADVCIINSCTVTHIADRKTRSTIRKIKRNSPNCVVVVTGCYVQTNIDELMKISEIDVLVDNTGKERIFDLVLTHTNERIVSQGDIFKESEYSKSGKLVSVQEQTRGFIKIQDGCNNFCSYCKIPFARGKSRSRSFEEVVTECQELSHRGYQEIVVIGINLSHYGEDLESKRSFIELLRAIVQIEGIKRIRIGSLYPEQITLEFVELMSFEPKMMPHIHLSLQSCSDSVLKGMNRHYSVNEVEDKITLLNSISNMRITSDIIVGFPSEGKEEFEESYQFLKQSKLSECHVFPYSKRENTKAASMVSKASPAEVSERVERMLALSNEKMHTFSQKMVGRECELLIENSEKGSLVGYSGNYVKVKILKPSSSIESGSLVNVKIVGIDDSILVGEII